MCVCGVPGSFILRDGVTSVDGIFEVPYVDAVFRAWCACVVFWRGGGARYLLLSTPMSAWVTYLYSLTG